MGTYPIGKTPNSNGSSKLEPIHYLGLSLWIAWSWSMHDAQLFLQVGDVTPDYHRWFTVDLMMRCGSIAALVAYGAMHRRDGAPRFPRLVIHLGLVTSTVGSLGLKLAMSTDAVLPANIAYGCAILAGLGSALLFLGWADIYATFPIRLVAQNAALSLACAGILGWLVTSVGSHAPAFCLAALPLGSYAFLLGAGGQQTDEPPAPHAVPGALPWQPIALLGCASFACGFSLTSFFTEAHRSRLGIIFVIGFAIVFIHALRLNARKSHDAAMATAVTIGSIPILVGILRPDPGNLAMWITSLSFGVASFLAFPSIALAAQRRGLSKPWSFALALGVSEFAALAGTRLRLALVALTVEPAVLAFLLPVILSMGALGLLALKATGDRAEELLDLVAAGKAASPMTLSTTMTLCHRRYGLTKRESEVITGIVDGLSYQQISDRMTVTLSTVKSHAHHAYQKLGVCNRIDAIELIIRTGEQQAYGRTPPPTDASNAHPRDGVPENR